MILYNGERSNGKTIKQNLDICENIFDLEQKLELAKQLNIPYKDIQKQLKSLYKQLDGGKNETNTKKRQKTEW